jgi:site-specific DNA-methyltransferase (adenine-specific)
LVNVFSEVKRVLADDGTLWLNLGDSYGKGKQLLGIPWRVAFALQQDGWYLRQDIIWSKPNPMPESVTDRCTKAHEYIFLLSKKAKYYYDADAVREEGSGRIPGNKVPQKIDDSRNDGGDGGILLAQQKPQDTRNKRSVWEVATQPYSGAHFATFPPKLIKPCILAGCPVGGTVLDPFGGGGTTGMVALELGRSAELIELNPDYVEIIKGRTNVTPGFNF